MDPKQKLLQVLLLQVLLEQVQVRREERSHFRMRHRWQRWSCNGSWTRGTHGWSSKRIHKRWIRRCRFRWLLRWSSRRSSRRKSRRRSRKGRWSSCHCWRLSHWHSTTCCHEITSSKRRRLHLTRLLKLLRRDRISRHCIRIRRIGRWYHCTTRERSGGLHSVTGTRKRRIIHTSTASSHHCHHTRTHGYWGSSTGSRSVHYRLVHHWNRGRSWLGHDVNRSRRRRGLPHVIRGWHCLLKVSCKHVKWIVTHYRCLLSVVCLSVCRYVISNRFKIDAWQ
jgi:hypothetical protein